jgi:hypothetical protein
MPRQVEATVAGPITPDGARPWVRLPGHVGPGPTY